MEERERSACVRTIYGIFLAMFTVVFGALFAIAAAGIYDGGTGVYSREIVGSRLKELIVPAIFWGIAVILGFLVSVLLPAREEKRRGDVRKTIRRLSRRIPQGESAEFLAERKKLDRIVWVRYIAWGACALFSVVAAVMSAVYLFDAAHFAGTDPTAEVKKLVGACLPWIGTALLMCCAAVVVETVLAGRELAATKKLILLGKGAPLPQNAHMGAEKVRDLLSSAWTIFVLRLVVFALGLTFFILGIVNGGQQDVLFKAINICRECIGLG